jgi:hypothetical protein
VSGPTKIEWTDCTCRPCGVILTAENIVEPGRHLCKSCKNKGARSRYIPTGPPKQYGPPPAPSRDGDKRQARKRVNQMVLSGQLPEPDDRPCADCGHLGLGRRHEYDHHKGYGAEHHATVEPVCASCHRKRALGRGEWHRRPR